VAAALAVAGAGCSGSGGDTSSGAPRLTHAQYVASAAAVCRRYQQQIVDLGTPSSLDGLAQAGEQALDLQRKELDTLRALRPPASEQAQVTEMLNGVEQAITTGQKLVTAAKSGDAATVASTASQLGTELQAANDLAAKLGLGDCVISR
jgi:hypothetical protein